MGSIKKSLKIGISTIALYSLLKTGCFCYKKYELYQNKGVKSIAESIVRNTGSYIKKVGTYMETIGIEEESNLEKQLEHLQNKNQKSCTSHYNTN